MRYVIFVFISFFSFSNFAQENSDLLLAEKELMLSLKNLRMAKDNAEKDSLNLLFKNQLKTTLEIPGSFHYPFLNLKTLGSIASPDSTFRLFNWNIEQDDKTQKYECLILKYNERKKDYFLIELTDNSENFFGRNLDIIEAQNWYGALYYQIIPIEKSGRQMYTVLGWDGNDQSSTIKMIDVLVFTGNTVKLGSPIFKYNGELLKRIYFEHSKKASMSLRYESKEDRIIFDHLSPETPNLEGFYSYYVPDMSYDALYFGNNKWTLKEDVIGINNSTDSKITVQVIDPETGEIKDVRIKNKWEDPTDINTPGGGNVHVAVLPEDTEGDKKSDKKEKKKTKDKTKGKQPKSNIRK